MRLVLGGRSASRLYNIYVRAPRLDDQPDGAVVVAKEGGAFTYGVDGGVDPSYLAPSGSWLSDLPNTRAVVDGTFGGSERGLLAGQHFSNCWLTC
jgi:hypothetical protein